MHFVQKGGKLANSTILSEPARNKVDLNKPRSVMLLQLTVVLQQCKFPLIMKNNPPAPPPSLLFQFRLHFRPQAFIFCYVRSLLFNYENQATRDVLLINWDEVYIIFFTKLTFWPVLIHQLAETLPLIFLGSHFLSKPHFVPAVAPSCDPAIDKGNEDPAAKSPQCCQFSDP